MAQDKADSRGIGCLILGAISIALIYGGYSAIDSVGWIPHRQETVITARENWFVGESKDCISYPLDGSAAAISAKPQGYSVAEIGCDDGPGHSVNVTFYGRMQQPEYTWIRWRCIRNERSFTCKQTDNSPRGNPGEVTGVYGGSVHNTTAQDRADFEISIHEQQGSVVGCMAVHRPLYGSGTLSGSFRQSQLIFDVESSGGTIRFIGNKTNGDIAGTYSVLRNGEVGEFELHRQGDLPSTFNPKDCPDDSVVH
jgi:hypothetical protein